MATAETRAAERRAKDERPEPKDEARKTDAEGTDARTRASAPGAHPTATDQPLARTEETTRETSRLEAGPEREREPQKPTRGATMDTTFRERTTTTRPAHQNGTGRKPLLAKKETTRAGSRVGSPKGFLLAKPGGREASFRGALYAATRVTTEPPTLAVIGFLGSCIVVWGYAP